MLSVYLFHKQYIIHLIYLLWFNVNIYTIYIYILFCNNTIGIIFFRIYIIWVLKELKLPLFLSILKSNP